MNLLIEGLMGLGHEVTLFTSADCSTKAKLVEVCDPLALGGLGSVSYGWTH